MSYHYFVVEVKTREQAQEVGQIFSKALPSAIAEGNACFDLKMHIVKSDEMLPSTHDKLEALIREQSAK